MPLTPERLARRKETTSLWYKRQVADAERKRKERRENLSPVFHARCCVELQGGFCWDCPSLVL